MMRIFGFGLLALLIAQSVSGTTLVTEASNSAAPKAFINVIEGTVYGPDRQPVPELWIELLNELGMGNRRIRTGASGRYTFSGMSPGRYVIKVYATGTPFEDATASVEIISVMQNSSDTVYQDVHLRYAKSKINTGPYQNKGAVFMQAVPAEAQQLYKNGIRDLSSNDAGKGRSELEQAIKLYPDYYDALNALGCNYVGIKEYRKSLPYLIHAIEINERSYSSFYALGYAAYKLGHLSEAVEATRAATILQPESINAQLLYGSVLRMKGSDDLAMTALKKAETLSKATPVPEIHWQLALLYAKLKRNSDAAEHLENYLRINPNAANRKEIQDLIKKLRTKST